MDFVILTDSSSDLTADLRNRFEIDDYLRGNLVYPDGHTEQADLDYKNISCDNFFNSMSNSKNTLFKTSIPSKPYCEEFFEKYLKQDKDILFICLSSAISGTYGLVTNVAKELMQKYPQHKIVCIDSLKYCMAEGSLVIKAAEMKKEGKLIQEIADKLNEEKFKMHQIGFMDDLFFLSKSGRIKTSLAFFGTLIGIKSMAEINREGMSQVIGKTKGYKKVYKAIIEYMKKTIIEPEKQIITISQSMRKKEAEIVKEMIINEFNPREVIISSVCQSCGASIGPGLVGIYYSGIELSVGLENEKAILASCVEKL